MQKKTMMTGPKKSETCNKGGTATKINRSLGKKHRINCHGRRPMDPKGGETPSVGEHSGAGRKWELAKTVKQENRELAKWSCQWGGKKGGNSRPSQSNSNIGGNGNTGRNVPQLGGQGGTKQA